MLCPREVFQRILNFSVSSVTVWDLQSVGIEIRFFLVVKINLKKCDLLNAFYAQQII